MRRPSPTFPPRCWTLPATGCRAGGRRPRFIDLGDDKLEPGRYNVITALDTLAHIPDLAGVVAGLHAALRPGGWLITNFDVRPPLPENAWHLYDDDLNLRAILHRAGFVPSGRFGDPASSFGQYLVYRRVDPSAAAQRLRVQLDRLVLTSRPRRAVRHRDRRLAAVIRSKIG
jgi:hypothetical protein